MLSSPLSVSTCSPLTRPLPPSISSARLSGLPLLNDPRRLPPQGPGGHPLQADELGPALAAGLESDVDEVQAPQVFQVLPVLGVASGGLAALLPYDPVRGLGLSGG